MFRLVQPQILHSLLSNFPEKVQIKFSESSATFKSANCSFELDASVLLVDQPLQEPCHVTVVTQDLQNALIGNTHHVTVVPQIDGLTLVYAFTNQTIKTRVSGIEEDEDLFFHENFGFEFKAICSCGLLNEALTDIELGQCLMEWNPQGIRIFAVSDFCESLVELARSCFISFATREALEEEASFKYNLRPLLRIVRETDKVALHLLRSGVLYIQASVPLANNGTQFVDHYLVPLVDADDN